ncbi:hypothetical protein [Caenispirillum salinarum]|uniref:hypothetical protein n=1 Tax=Caenispirillum salinarum TaxID=859058 RepID=UPI00384AFE5B
MPAQTTADTGILNVNGFTDAEIIDASRLSLAVYDRPGSGPTTVEGWSPLLEDLTLPDGDPGTFDPTTGFYINGNASAVVMMSDDGTLAISFAGTSSEEPWYDMLEYWTLDSDRLRSQYFNDLKGLVETVFDYAMGNGISDVLLTGHSLGGAATTGTFDWLETTGSTYDALNIEGITFNSPVTGYHPDKPMVELAFTNDLIGEIVGQDAANVINNIWYAVNPSAVAPEYDPTNPLSYAAQLFQASTTPEHDITRFTESFPELLKSPIYGDLGADDFLIIDNFDYGVSVDTITTLSPAAADMVAAADVVGMLGDDIDDVLVGSGKTDLMDGREGNDILKGRQGDDRMWGGEDDDVLFGNGGSDILNGEEGNDRLEGGGGKDTFVLDGVFGHDVIADWRNGETLSFTDPGYGAEIGNQKQLKDWVDSTEGVSVVSGSGDPLTIAVRDDGMVTFENIQTWDDAAVA